jgi:hypothetical protein
MSECPEKIEQSEKYPNETTSFILGNCYDEKETAELVKWWNCRDALLEACERHKKITIANYGNLHWDANYKQMEAALAAAKE